MLAFTEIDSAGLEILTSEAWDVFGPPAQLDMMIEECAELIQAIEHFRRALQFRQFDIGEARAQIALECADVLHMIAGIEQGLGITERIVRASNDKIDHLRERLQAARQWKQGEIELKGSDNADTGGTEIPNPETVPDGL